MHSAVENLLTDEVMQVMGEVDDRRVSLSVASTPLSSVLLGLAIDSGASISVAAKFGDAPVTLSVADERLQVVLESLAAMVGAQVVKTEGLYRITEESDESQRATGYGRLGRLSADDFDSLVALTGSGFRAERFPGGAFIASGRESQLREFVTRAQYIASQPRTTWAIHLDLVEMSCGDAQRLGVETNVEGQLGYTTALGFDASAALRAALESKFELFKSRTVSRPVLLTNDGQLVKFERGEKYPVRTTTAYENRTVEGVSFVDVGFILALTPTSIAPEVCLLEIQIEDKTLAASVGDNPVVGGYSFTGQVDLRVGEPHLVATIQTEASEDSGKWGLELFRSVVDSQRVTLVFATLVPVSGVVNESVDIQGVL